MKDKIEGIVSDKQLFGGLIGEMKHHYGANKMKLILYTGNIEAAIYRGEKLEEDLQTLNNALVEILNIAKKNNYAEVIEILKKKEYEHGVEKEIKPLSNSPKYL